MKRKDAAGKAKQGRSFQPDGALHGGVFNRTPCGCHTLDSRGRFTDVNGMELRWLGYAREELVGKKKLDDIVTPAGLGALKKAQAALKKSGHVHGLELEWVRRNGTTITVLTNAEAFKDGRGRPILSQWASFDITEIKRSGESLRQQEEMFRRIYEKAGFGMVILDMADQVLGVNEEFRRMTGYSQDELFGQPLANISRPDGNAQEKTGAVAGRRRSEAGNVLQCRIARKNGSIFYVVSKSLIFAARSGAPLFKVAWMHDITGQRLAVDALRKSMEQIQDLYDNAPCGYHSLDERGVFLRINDTELKWIDYTREEIIGKMAFLDIIDAASHDKYRIEFKKFKQTGQASNLEFNFVRKDGTVFPILLNATAIRDGQGRYVASRSMVLDVTRRKKDEEALRESEEKFSKAFQLNQASMAITTQGGRYLTVNRAFAAMLEWPESEARGKTSVQLGLWDNPEDGVQIGRLLEKQGHVRDCPVRMRTKSGHLLDVLFSAERVDIYNEPCLLLLAYNITERRQAERALMRQSTFNELMTRILTRFANSPEGGMSDLIRDALQSIAEFTRVDHAYLVLESCGPSAVTDCAYEWAGAGVDSIFKDGASILPDALFWTDSCLASGKPLIINTPADIPPEAVADRRFYEIEGCRSALKVPIMGASGTVRGRIALHSHAGSVTWSDDDVTRLKMVGNAIVNLVERNKANQMRNEAETRYKKIFENAPIGIFQTSPEGRLMKGNPMLARMMGFPTVEEMLARVTDLSSQVYVDPQVRAQMLAAMRKTDGWIFYETLFKRPDGSTITANLSVRRQLNPDGSLAYLEGFAEDRDAERHLFGERIRAQQYLDVVQVIMLALDLKGNIVMLNRKGCELLGCTAAEVLGKNWYELFIPKRKYREVRSVSKKLMIGETDHFEYVESIVQTRTHGERIIAWHNIALHSDDGDVVGILSSGEDITTQSEFKNALLRKQLALHAVYKMTTSVNQPFEEMCATVEASLSELTDTDHVFVRIFGKEETDARPSGAKGPRLPLAGGPERTPGEPGAAFQFHQKFEETFPEEPFFNSHTVRCYLEVPLIDGRGKRIGCLCAMDKTERKYDTEEIQLFEIFSRFLASRQDLLELERELVESQKMRLMGQLTSGVAHEVRNPLNAILALTEVLVKNVGPDEKYQMFLRHIREQVERLSQLMKDLLDLGKPLQPQNLASISLTDLCRSAVDQWQKSHPEDGHHVHVVRPEPCNDMVTVDVMKMQQVFINLLSNASHHSPAESEITIHIQPLEDGGIRMRVRDQGSGIKPEYLGRVFEPFFTTRTKGTGLGLNLVKHMVEIHDGTVRLINNAEGPGCTAEIFLPARGT